LLEVRRTTRLRKGERERLFGWDADVFGSRVLDVKWQPPRWRFLVYADGELVSHAGALLETVRVGETPTTVGGIGGLVTVPQAQRRGYARIAMEAALAFLSGTRRVHFALIFCRDALVPYYGRLGFVRPSGPVLIDRPSGRRPCPLAALVRPLRELPWPPGTIEISGPLW
jgi:GNAT superfamily N-acetyltransferase